jgi:hypothetical protein
MGVTLEDLSAKLAALEARETALAEREAALAKGTGKVSFGPSEKNPKFMVFKHGTKDAWPIASTPEAWRVVVANVELIKKTLKIA